MPALKLTTFGGMQPRRDVADLPNNYAEKSVNVNYYSGDLSPYNAFELDREIPENSKTIYPFINDKGDKEWFVSPKRYKIIKHHGTAENQRVIISGEGRPLTTTFDLFPEVRFLGVPKPQETPYAILGLGGTGVALSTLYVYTYVNEFDEESQPSDASPAVLKKDGQLTVVNIGQQPFINGVVVKKKRLYRSVAIEGASSYQFLAEVPAQQTSFVDTYTNDALSEVLDTLDWQPSEEDLRNIIMMANGIYVGHTDKEIYFSEPYIAYAYPVKYSISIQHKILDIALTGDRSFIVMTDEKPYFIYGDTPDNMTIIESKAKFPGIKNTLVDMGGGAMYATYEGIVYATGTSRIQLITSKAHSKETFASIIPEETFAYRDEKRYFLITNSGTIVFDKDTPDFISNISYKPNAVHFSEDKFELFCSLNGHLVEFYKKKTRWVSQTWESKNIRTAEYVNMSAYRILADYKDDMIEEDDFVDVPTSPIGGWVNGGLLRLTQVSKVVDKTKPFIFIRFKRGDKIIHERFIQSDKIYRLPKTYKDDKVSFEIQSNIRIREFHLGTTPFSLKTV